jgi:hypothetical protein
METISFALGVASVLIVLLSAVTIWNMLKVKKLTKEKENLHILINNVEQNLYKKIDDVDRNVHETFRDVYNIIDKHYEETGRNMGESHKNLEDFLVSNINNVSIENKKYVDSRVDKLIDAYFIRQTSNVVNDVVSTTKQIIKG